MKRLLIFGLLVTAVSVLPASALHAWEHCDTDHPEKDCQTTTTPATTPPTTVTTVPQTTTAPRGTLPVSESTTTTQESGPPVSIERGTLPVASTLPNTGPSDHTPSYVAIGAGLVAIGSLAGLARKKRV